MHRALVVRGKCNYWRMNTVYIKFNENSVVLVNKKVVPVSKRVYGPILKELCMRWPTLGCVSRLMI
jgi:ribosomal protein L14